MVIMAVIMVMVMVMVMDGMVVIMVMVMVMAMVVMDIALTMGDMEEDTEDTVTGPIMEDTDMAVMVAAMGMAAAMATPASMGAGKERAKE